MQKKENNDRRYFGYQTSLNILQKKSPFYWEMRNVFTRKINKIFCFACLQVCHFTSITFLSIQYLFFGESSCVCTPGRITEFLILLAKERIKKNNSKMMFLTMIVIEKAYSFSFTMLNILFTLEGKYAFFIGNILKYIIEISSICGSSFCYHITKWLNGKYFN